MSHVAIRILAAATLALAGSAGAQPTASASLAVQAQIVTPLQIAVTHGLDFGKMLAPSAKTVAPTAAGAGRFYLVGQGGSAVTLTLSMPSQLTPSAGSNLPISAWSYVLSDVASLTGAAVSFAGGTAVPISATLPSAAGSVNLYVGIGATATASASHAAGVYSGTGQITATYSDL